jgi:hypothetical protein
MGLSKSLGIFFLGVLDKNLLKNECLSQTNINPVLLATIIAKI